MDFLARVAYLDLTLGWLQPGQAAYAVVTHRIPQFIQQKSFYRTCFTLALLVIILGSVNWLRPAPVIQARSLAQAEPTSGLTIEVVGPAAVAVGDTFEVQIVVNNSLPSGIFGYQFWLDWNPAVVAPVEAAPILSPDFPLMAQTEISEGQFRVTASREGDVEGLTGSLTLLTWTFQAKAAADLDVAHFDLTLVTLGQKDGTELPLDAITNLTVTIVETALQRGNLSGNVQVEGRASGSQAGFSILINELGLAATTTPGGDFAFADVEFGPYTLTANSPGFLSATCTGLTHSSESTNLAGVTLLAGDLTGDGLIDVADATAIGLASGSAPDVAADLNGDGGVNVLDLILLAVNFGQSAADHPWVCQP
ncbi:MAG: hypothetical protein HYR94_04670 [Chloroflexi bacterium]|nr:hypothetical protein [Chloroflexota bacterium]